MIRRQQSWIAQVYLNHSGIRSHGHPCAKRGRLRIPCIGNDGSDDLAFSLHVILARSRGRRCRRLLSQCPRAQCNHRRGTYPELSAAHVRLFSEKFPHPTNLTPLFANYEPSHHKNVALQENFPILPSKDFSLTQLFLPDIIICTSILRRFDKLNSARCGGERPGWRQNIFL
jgi:hypothetical protein